ncbi:MAG: polyribonucleotide nucleotidyltransferase [Treponemataceae bacterium]
MVQRVSYKIGNEELILETGRFAKQTNGTIYAQFGGSAILATVCCSSSAKEGLDYVPLTVDYNEKYYAAGKIPGGFVKREGRPKDKEILVSRLIDRPMRPLFENSFGRDIQLIPTCISTDQVNPPDMLAIIASSAAVHISDIPFNGPVAGVRICYKNGEYIMNPTFEQIESAEMEIVVAGTAEGITMVEGGAHEVSEEIMLEALEKGKEFIKIMCKLQDDLRALVGLEKLPLCPLQIELENKATIESAAYPLLEAACFIKGKHERYAAINKVKSDFEEKYATQIEDETQKKLFDASFEDMQYRILRINILDKNLRLDGRNTEQIRDITCEIDVLPRPHGSALFTRGETQSLCVATLGTVFDEQSYDDIDGDRKEHFILHYNFPPYSVGEVGRMGTGRREIGHGNLARRSLEPMVPSKAAFPYTVRVVSEILESNGSSSMATVCGGTLCMLQAGVPMKKPVAGIAMGLITDGDKFAVLSDILGDEDHLGDMDFKVAGTVDGITGFQMDIKIAGVSTEIMKKALSQAKAGRLHILNEMNKVISKPAEKMSEYAPKISAIKIDPEKLGALIGPGGKVIKAISEKHQVTINTDNDGTVTIYAKNTKSADSALAAVKGIVEDPEVGRIYEGTIKRIMDFGAFIEILPGKEGLCHISKFSKEKIVKVSDVVQEGQSISVKLLEIDKMGRLNLSAVDAQQK